MHAPSALVALSGSAAVRTTVNSAFHWYARRRTTALASADPIEVQRRALLGLVRAARDTRFGRDHGFAGINSVEAFQSAVTLRTYEELWDAYLKPSYPVLDDVTWPGRIPFFALTSGTTQGATKYIPVSREMVASNKKAGFTMMAYHMATHPQSALFHGRHFFLGGSTNLEEPAPGVRQGDLSGIAAEQLVDVLRPYTFPPLELALESDWDRKLNRLAEGSLSLKITSIAGVPSWLLMLFGKLLDLSGKSTIAEVWPDLEMVIHGGVKFDPYRHAFEEAIGSPAVRFQETYPCSEGFIAFGDPATGLLRLMTDHGLFYEFVPVDELGSERPTRHWLGTVEPGVNYAIVVSTCAGMWAHIIGDTVRFESTRPPLLIFTGRTKYTLSAFGEHLISEEVEAAIAVASEETGASVRDWHVGPVFLGALGYHQFIVEFLKSPSDLDAFRERLDADLGRRNADYQAHRAEGVGLPLPAILVAKPGGIDAWMRSKGKLGGQHKVPRMDGAGTLAAEIAGMLREAGLVECELPAGRAED
jgi:hypothetical protein